MKHLLKPLFILAVFVCLFYGHSIGQQRKVALMDLSARNAETNTSRLTSCQWILNTAGVEYINTNSLPTALTYPVVLFTSLIQSSTFTSAERTTITNYVTNGGVIIFSNMQASSLHSLCGASANSSSTTRKMFTLNTTNLPWLRERITDVNEITTRFLGTESGSTCSSRSYTLNGGTLLGQYEDGACGFVYKATGTGHTYTFGLDLRDVIHRFQINGDGGAQRTYSNGFEPGSDVFVLLIQNIIRHHIPNTVRLHTSPWCSTSSVIITHDVDSRTGVDTCHFFADFEYNRGIKTTYNVTTRYFSDSWLSAFYNSSYSSVEYLLSKGHTLGSHSVGHFPDFSKTSVFPLGTIAITQATYNPSYNNSVTTGGTVFGEIQVSKVILEADHHQPIKTFRSGHLGYNKRQPYALAQSGYKFNSSFSANDVLNNFPFYTTDNLSNSGAKMPVLEIPMTISDASTQFPISSTNYPSVVAIWTSVTRKNDANNAPTVLLVHPNRQWKILAEAMYLDSLPTTSVITTMEEFGEFWQERDTLDFTSTLTNNNLRIQINTNTPDERLSYVIDNAQQLTEVTFFLQNGEQFYPASSPWVNGATIYCSPEMRSTAVEETPVKTSAIVFPNPASSTVYFNIENATKGKYTLNVYDVMGQTVIYSQQLNMAGSGRLTFPWNVEHLTTGCYFFSIQSETVSTNGKLMVVH